MKNHQVKKPNYRIMNIVCFHFGKNKTPTCAHISMGLEKLVDTSSWTGLFLIGLFHLEEALLLRDFLKN